MYLIFLNLDHTDPMYSINRSIVLENPTGFDTMVVMRWCGECAMVPHNILSEDV